MACHQGMLVMWCSSCSKLFPRCCPLHSLLTRFSASCQFPCLMHLNVHLRAGQPLSHPRNHAFHCHSSQAAVMVNLAKVLQLSRHDAVYESFFFDVQILQIVSICHLIYWHSLKRFQHLSPSLLIFFELFCSI